MLSQHYLHIVGFVNELKPENGIIVGLVVVLWVDSDKIAKFNKIISILTNLVCILVILRHH